MKQHSTTTVPGFSTTDRRARYCAGSMRYGHVVHRDLLHARLATLRGLWSPEQLDQDAPVFTDPQAFLDHHGRDE